MKFADIPVAEAEGAILAHSLKLDGAHGRRLGKGRMLSTEDLQALAASGHRKIAVARLDPDDVHENEAAATLAAAAAGANLETSKPFTGRCNLFATGHGLAVFDHARLDRLNLVHEAATIATVPAFAAVEPRQMIATIKIVPFAAARRVLDETAAIAGEGGPLIRVAPFKATAVGLVQSRLAGTKEAILDKTAAVMTARLANLESRIAGELRRAHTEADVAEGMERLIAEGCELVLVVGASAITDRRDVIPAALTRIGGAVEHFGMPVDPGQLLMLGRRGDVPVLGVPGCGRSPKINGFDWVLRRLIAGIPVTGRDIMLMGAGGLLAEFEGRPMPRARAGSAETHGAEARGKATQRAPRVAAIVLVAGQSRRMGAINKLLAEIDGVPMLNRVIDGVLGSNAGPVVVVTGHEEERVAKAIGRRRKIERVHNPDYAQGLSTSLARGIAALPEDSDGVLVCLGDMPRVSAKVIDRLIDAFNPREGRAICVPTHRGKRGNPVLFGRRFFAEMKVVSGDVGARHLIGEHGEVVAEVEMADDAVLLDVDSPDALTAIKRARKT
jgi:molybdenum cofactor cytidylyltransferase